MIVDAHIHSAYKIGGGFVRDAGRYGMASKAAGDFRMLPPSFDPTGCPPELTLEYMDWVGVDRAFLIQGMFYGWHNEERVYARMKWPDRFTAFALVRPDDPNSGEQLERWLDAGLQGVGEIEVGIFKSMFPGFQLLGGVARQWWEICNRRNVPVMLHLSEGRVDVEDVLTLVREYERLTIIIAHLGLPPHPGWLEQVKLGIHPRIMVELSALPGQFDQEGYPYPGAQSALAGAISEIGSDKILWGSDFPGILPFCTYRQTLDLVRRNCSFLSPAQKDAILGENALRVIRSISSD